MTRGGTRSGAGRPAGGPGENRQPRTFRLLPAAHASLEAQAKAAGVDARTMLERLILGYEP